MADDSEIPAELQGQFEQAILADFKEHLEELRRSFEISSTFYEKLATLDAASIAIAASVGVGLFVKLGLSPASVHQMLRWLVPTVLLLWLSLISAVGHNFLVAKIAELEASYSHEVFMRNMLKKSLDLARKINPEVDGAQLARLQEIVHEDPRKKQQRLVARKEQLQHWSPRIGHISVTSFLLAYSLVVICIVVIECRF